MTTILQVNLDGIPASTNATAILTDGTDATFWTVANGPASRPGTVYFGDLPASDVGGQQVRLRVRARAAAGTTVPTLISNPADPDGALLAGPVIGPLTTQFADHYITFTLDWVPDPGYLSYQDYLHFNAFGWDVSEVSIAPPSAAAVPPTVYANNPRAVTVSVALTPSGGGSPVTLDPVDLAVVWDAGLAWRTTAALTVPFDLATWGLVKDFTASRVSASCGLVQPNGTVVAVPLTGPMVVRRSTVRRPEDVILLELASEASIVDDLRFTAATNAYPGANAATQIRNLILAALPNAVFTQTGPNGAALNAESSFASSRWKAVEAVCDYAGLEVWQDTDAAFVIRPQPLQLATPVDTLMVGAGGNIIQSSSDFDRDTFANAYVVRCVYANVNGQTDQASGIAYDNDPASPTRWNGPAGNRIAGDLENIRLTDLEAAAMARSRLARTLGHGRGVRLTTPLRPWLKPGDPVAVELPTGGVQLQTVQRVEHSFPAMTTVIDTRLLPDTAPTILVAPELLPAPV